MGPRTVLIICVRIFVETLSWIVFGIRNWNKSHRPLPPITNKLLLESASSLAEKIRSRQVSSEEVVNIFIERIKITNVSLNAVIETRFVQAIQEAKEVDNFLRDNSKVSEELRKSKPLYGVPITIKENLPVKGCHSTLGVYASKDNISEVDCESVRIMKKAGAIILGTTNIPELAMWWETANSIYGRTNNPYDLRRMVAGSSGGEASIISAAGSPLGLGSDIAGSIRMPAHFTGIFGHKASTGIISISGMNPITCELLNKYRTSGPLCRFACDLRLTLSLLTDHTDLVNFDKKLDLKNLKIYYMEDDGGCLTTPVSPEVRGALLKTLAYFKKAYNVSCKKVNITGLKSVSTFLAKLGEDPNVPSTGRMLTNGQYELNIEWELLKMLFGKSRCTFPSLLSAIVKKYSAVDHSSQRYKNNIDNFKSIADTFKEILTDNAIFLYPPSSTTALYHQETYFKPFNFMYTSMFNMLGLPATVCPVGLSSSGLPIGVQIVGGLYQDNLCISVAEEIERAFGGWVSPSEIQ